MAATRRDARSGMSNRCCAVYRSTASSSIVRRSSRSVANPATCNDWATARLRVLLRLLPLPWAKITIPCAPSGMVRSASSIARPAGMRTDDWWVEP